MTSHKRALTTDDNDDGDAIYDTIVNTRRRRIADCLSSTFENAVESVSSSSTISSSTTSSSSTSLSSINIFDGNQLQHNVSGVVVSRLKRKFANVENDDENDDENDAVSNSERSEFSTNVLSKRKHDDERSEFSSSSSSYSYTKRKRILEHSKLFVRCVRAVVSRVEDLFFSGSIVPQTPHEFLLFLDEHSAMLVGEHECGTIQALHCLLQLGVVRIDDFGCVSADVPSLANHETLQQLHECRELLLPPQFERAYDDMNGEMFVTIISSIVAQLRVSASFCLPLDQFLHALTPLCRIQQRFEPQDIFRTLINHGVLVIDDANERQQLHFNLIPRQQQIQQQQQEFQHSHGVEAF